MDIDYRLFEKFGSFIDKDGVFFRVYAPNAKEVSVVGDFNGYEMGKNVLENKNGIWEGFVKGAKKGDTYKYAIVTKDNRIFYKADPFSRLYETPPKSASIIYEFDYKFNDNDWMKKRAKLQDYDMPLSIYEVHLGSWKKGLNYKELALELSKYAKEMNFTHIEIMPVTEYPFDGSWGYQALGYFAPTSRFGKPEEFAEFVDILHQEGIGVIMDWVPSHFVTDGHGLISFDGSALYEYEDPRKGYHPEWGSMIFDYNKRWVRNFLISSAFYFLEKFHIDGIRVDAVASMLYLDYARKDGEWVPNKYGGNENLEAISFLKELNGAVKTEFGDCLMVAEESTAFPGVTKKEGLGFDYKWNMGWMHDTLRYFSKDPIYRQYHHNELTFTFYYGFDERFILPLSHDEVVHMKGSLMTKMPGGHIEKFANIRALFSYMYAHPGKKLLFMGDEIAQFREWDFAGEIDWYLLEDVGNRGVQSLVKDLNYLYKTKKALYKTDNNPNSLEWIDVYNYQNNILSFIRKYEDEEIIIVCNFSNIIQKYRVGANKGEYIEIFNSQDEKYAGSGIKNEGILKAQKIESFGREYSFEITLPQLSVIYLEKKGD